MCEAFRFAFGNQTAEGSREIKECQEKAVYQNNETTSAASTTRLFIAHRFRLFIGHSLCGMAGFLFR